MISLSSWGRHKRTALSLSAAAITLCVLVLSPLSIADSTSYYRWLDANGKLVISDRPPPSGQPFEEVTASGQRRPQPGVAPSVTGVEAASNMASSEAADPRTCQIAKDNLHALETTEMIRSRGADGEYYYLNDEEKQLQVERASALIRVHCRDGGEGDAK